MSHLRRIGKERNVLNASLSNLAIQMLAQIAGSPLRKQKLFEDTVVKLLVKVAAQIFKTMWGLGLKVLE